MKADECPNATDPTHRTGPAGYIARAEWREAMTKTHKQSQCPICGLWVVWTPKPRAVGRMGLSGNLKVDLRPSDEAIAEQAAMTEAYYADPDV